MEQVTSQRGGNAKNVTNGDVARNAVAPNKVTAKKRDKKINIAVHPLFWVFGIYFCFTGKLFIFLLMTFAALEHELAHAFAGARLGYALNKIVLMPYGAVVKGDIGSITLQDELSVAIAGPFISGVTALAFVAVWWLFPESYAFTDTVVQACASLALVNLIPALPLDGGRILYCTLAHFIPKKRAWVVCRVLSLLFCLLLLGGFIYSIFHTLNLSLLFFSLFLLVGCLEGDKYAYERVHFSLVTDLNRGLEERRVAVSCNFTARKVIPLLRRDKYLWLDVFDGEEKRIGEIGQDKLCSWLENANLEDAVGEILVNK